jgi:hypothetical protein
LQHRDHLFGYGIIPQPSLVRRRWVSAGPLDQDRRHWLPVLGWPDHRARRWVVGRSLAGFGLGVEPFEVPDRVQQFRVAHFVGIEDGDVLTQSAASVIADE